MHPDEEALLRALQAAPDDQGLRLVYADWLDEHEYPNLAALYRRPAPLRPRGSRRPAASPPPPARRPGGRPRTGH